MIINPFNLVLAHGQGAVLQLVRCGLSVLSVETGVLPELSYSRKLTSCLVSFSLPGVTLPRKLWGLESSASYISARLRSQMRVQVGSIQWL